MVHKWTSLCEFGAEELFCIGPVVLQIKQKIKCAVRAGWHNPLALMKKCQRNRRESVVNAVFCLSGYWQWKSGRPPHQMMNSKIVVSCRERFPAVTLLIFLDLNDQQFQASRLLLLKICLWLQSKRISHSKCSSKEFVR